MDQERSFMWQRMHLLIYLDSSHTIPRSDPTQVLFLWLCPNNVRYHFTLIALNLIQQWDSNPWEEGLWVHCFTVWKTHKIPLQGLNDLGCLQWSFPWVIAFCISFALFFVIYYQLGFFPPQVWHVAWRYKFWPVTAWELFICLYKISFLPSLF